MANFVNLQIPLAILNLNTNNLLFTSRVGSQAFNASFTAGQIIKIIEGFACNSGERGVFVGILIFSALALLVLTLMIFIKSGSVNLDVTSKIIIMVFVGLIIGVVFLGEVANTIDVFCSLA